jgi:alginate O-acetyltransferase complex protein AlgI
MWPLAFSVYFGCKLLTWWTTPADASVWRQLGYLLAWPGMDAAAFLTTSSRRKPTIGDGLFALGKIGFGAVLLWIVTPRAPENALLRGWIGLVGIGFILHLGLFHLLSLGWQALGVHARPLMNWPICSESVSEFWGQRWNLAFRDLTHRFLFRPLTPSIGAKPALVVGFLISGMVHDLVISLPAGGGYGGPTLFFILQAAAILLERSALGKRLGLGRGVIGWIFTLIVLVGPVFLLFHAPFVTNVISPFVEWIIQ